ncbi:prepilin-type N-terminal cleavage/methylation domain-containing protein [[Clostridium] symbiosum]|uniref:prepilin-type N-terminal cleavage/methylation domain-containing protein n=1 Tax=Clostridium symbiosum TaxID=1512 RepID=UPI001D085C44|nr:prepilin-type N-terminal cleavage/methylation domain-containing protein [[Clostridium] symbiosum]MCB6608114.1 prepilin-type N-terminal cleavage/methylation domain-containing protein [[Clostridium] symbiosum]MCB6931046.1 prepilin-type N-terminal cleavage/methylation domain-containing protein [[Clostridium] symbiosum]
MKKKTDRGFSLIELIIAIAILIILTGLLAPQFMKYIEKSRKAACLNNVDVMIKEYQVAMIDNPDITPEEVLEMMVKRGMECPSKGEYKILYPKGNKDSFVVNCRVHGNVEGASTDPKVAIGDSVYEEMRKFIDRNIYSTDQIVELLKKAGVLEKNQGIKSVSNDKIREYLLNNIYNGQWPKADEKLFGIPSGQSFYIQPYIDLVGKGGIENVGQESIFTYIGKRPDNTGNRWVAYYIYDNEHQKWYKDPTGNGLRIQEKTWDKVKSETIDKGWIPVN